MVFSMERWSGKVAVVTGASSGIGVKIVEKLVKNGMIVIGLARRVELVEKLSKELQDQPGKLHPMKVDLTNDDEIVKAFGEIETKFKSIHVLVNNAGAYPPGRLWNGKIEEWRKIIDTNVMALCITTKETIRIMRTNGVEGVIININSVVGHRLYPVLDLQMYTASKYAVTAICDTLRMELISEKSKIRVTSISPGSTRSEQIQHLDLSGLGGAPFLNPEDIADSVEYVLSVPDHVQIQELTVTAIAEPV